jgi:hypothetical protein
MGVRPLRAVTRLLSLPQVWSLNTPEFVNLLAGPDRGCMDKLCSALPCRDMLGICVAYIPRCTTATG